MKKEIMAGLLLALAFTLSCSDKKEKAEQAAEAAKQAAEAKQVAEAKLAAEAEQAAEAAKKKAEQELAESAKNPSAAIKELEAAAKKWQKDGKATSGSSFFTFSAKGGEEGYVWKATSKENIGDCPAKSVWEMGYEGCERWNNVPAKCKSITPKAISSYSGDSGC